MRDVPRLVAAALLTAVLTDGACADAAPDPAALPAFDAADQKIIARNATLRSLEKADPWLVRRVLDDLARAPASARDPAGGNPDPDLDRLRTSPEGLNDLFQVLKAAGSKNPGGGPKK